MKLYLLLALVTIAAASAQTIVVAPGEPFMLQSDVRAPLPISQISADYSIQSIGFFHRTVVNHPTSSLISDELAIDAPSGAYPLLVTLRADNDITRRSTVTIIINGSEQNQTVNTSRPFISPTATVTIPAIPDTTPGTTLVLPVKITGIGTYTLSIPSLGFATYEMPESVDVHGESVVPVLLHVHPDAKPGTYSVPIRAGSDETTARVRIIKYVVHKDYTQLFIWIGIALILIGALIVLLRRPRKPRETVERVSEDSEVITYY